MAKKCDNYFLDGNLERVATCVTLSVCAGEPANQAAVAGLALATVVLTAGDGNGDYVIADGDASGRKVTAQQQADLNISSNGDADHVVLDDGTYIYVTTCTLQNLTSGGTVTVPAFDAEVADPA